LYIQQNEPTRLTALSLEPLGQRRDAVVEALGLAASALAVSAAPDQGAPGECSVSVAISRFAD